jgi:DNA replication ATP-dependent helicase Dna2
VIGGKEVRTVAEVETLFQSAKIVATTCLSINHALFAKRRFDYCIVDEASQLTLPVCLGTCLPLS